MAGIKITALPPAPSAQLTDVFPIDGLPGPVTYKESNAQLLSLFQTTLGISGSPTNGQLPIGNGTNFTLSTLTSGAGITVTNGSGSITISSSTSGMTWTTVTTSQLTIIDSGYVANNAAPLTFTLPASASVGDTIAIEGLGSGGWVLTANGGQTIKIGSTTTSSAGSLSSAAPSDNVYVTCIVANTTWRVRTTNSAGLNIS